MHRHGIDEKRILIAAEESLLSPNPHGIDELREELFPLGCDLHQARRDVAVAEVGHLTAGDLCSGTNYAIRKQHRPAGAPFLDQMQGTIDTRSGPLDEPLGKTPSQERYLWSPSHWCSCKTCDKNRLPSLFEEIVDPSELKCQNAKG